MLESFDAIEVFFLGNFARVDCLELDVSPLYKSMIRARVRLPRMNSPNFALGITGRVQNVTLVILRHGSLALYKVRQSLKRGVKFDIIPLLEANVVLDVRASPIIEHASSKLKFFIFEVILINLSIKLSYVIILFFNYYFLVGLSFDVSKLQTAALLFRQLVDNIPYDVQFVFLNHPF